MQTTITVRNGTFPISKTQVFHGITVPWETLGYAQEQKLADTSGGFFDLTHYGTVSVVGPDAADFLHRMSTVDIKKLVVGQIVYGAFLTGKGTTIALGLFWRMAEQDFKILVSPPQKGGLLEHLDKFHFAESLELKDSSEDFDVYGIWNINAFPPESSPEGFVWADPRRPLLTWVAVIKSDGPAFLEKAKSLGWPLLGQRLFQFYRIEAGVPEMGEELTSSDLILEGNFNEAVARNKGCYPGQEVVERIFTYGQVNRKLMRVEIVGTWPQLPKLPYALVENEKTVLTLVSCAFLPSEPGRAWGLAFVNKHLWSRTEPWIVDGGVSIRIRPETVSKES